MSNIGVTYQLEARVNIAGENNSCGVCGRWTERIPGSTVCCEDRPSRVIIDVKAGSTGERQAHPPKGISVS